MCPAASWGHDFLIFSIISFTFSFAKVFSFNYLITFLRSVIWYSQKCPVSQNIWCLTKTQLKNITQTIFQGGSPWATLIHNSVVCFQGTLLCPDASWCDVFSSIPFTFSFAKVFFSFMVFLWYYYWISMEFLWGFHDVSMIFLEDFYGISEGVLWEFYGILMGFPLDSYGISMVFLLASYGISIGFLWDFQGISMMFLWYFYGIIIGILMGCLLWFLCYSMLFLWSFYGISVRFLWDFHGISMIFLWDYYWISMGCRLKVNWQ